MSMYQSHARRLLTKSARDTVVAVNGMDDVFIAPKTKYGLVKSGAGDLKHFKDGQRIITSKDDSNCGSPEEFPASDHPASVLSHESRDSAYKRKLLHKLTLIDLHCRGKTKKKDFTVKNVGNVTTPLSAKDGVKVQSAGLLRAQPSVTTIRKLQPSLASYVLASAESPSRRPSVDLKEANENELLYSNTNSPEKELEIYARIPTSHSKRRKTLVNTIANVTGELEVFENHGSGTCLKPEGFNLPLPVKSNFDSGSCFHPKMSRNKNEASLVSAENPTTFREISKEIGAAGHGRSADLVPVDLGQQVMPNVTEDIPVEELQKISTEYISTEDSRDPRNTLTVSDQTMKKSAQRTRNECIDTYNEVTEPEYLDSFSTAAPLNFCKSFPRAKHRKLELESFQNRSRLFTPTDRTVTSSLAYFRELSSRALNTAFRDRENTDDKCPNCQEPLQRASQAHVVPVGQEKTFLFWILSKWGKGKEFKHFNTNFQRVYLPHYCSFVRGMTLYNRGNSLDDDDDNSVHEFYLKNTDLSLTEADLKKRKPGKSKFTAGTSHKKNAGSHNDGKNSGPPNSPSSAESLYDKLAQKGMTGSSFRQAIQIPSGDGPNQSTDSAHWKFDKDDSKSSEALATDQVKPAYDPSSGTKGKRDVCPKKEKLPGKAKKRQGKKKANMADEDRESGGPLTQVAEQNQEGPAQGDVGSDVLVDIAVPDLPAVNSSAVVSIRDQRRKGSRQLIAPPMSSEKNASKKPPATNEPTFTYYDFGEMATAGIQTPDDKASMSFQVPSYLNDRLVLSRQSSRFELPMDMKSLETMSPQTYLRNHCIVSTRRKTLYSKIFQKHRERTGSILGKITLSKALREVLVNTITKEHTEDLCELLEIKDDTSIDLKLFSGIAACAERILYPLFITEDTVDRPEYQREQVECADFSALEWKLHGVDVSKHIRRILESLG